MVCILKNDANTQTEGNPSLSDQSLFTHIKRMWGEYTDTQHLGVVW